jgi:hypothetical protein
MPFFMSIHPVSQAKLEIESVFTSKIAIKWSTLTINCKQK